MTSEEPTAPVPTVEQERHATWAELFFDLMVVAGVGLLAHVLATDLSAEAVGLYAVLFPAFWLCWTAFMLYGNVAAGNTHIVRLLFGMVGLGVMAASVPGIAHNVLEDGHEPHVFNAFAIAYAVTRVYGSQAWSRGEVLLDFPIAQHSAGVLPWIASIWVEDDYKIWCWAVGIVLDLILVFAVSGSEMLARYEHRVEQVKAGSRRGGGPGRDPSEKEFEIKGLTTDPVHLAERLGLFVIIVLGEGLIQVVDAASETEFRHGLLRAGVMSFVLLAGMFGLSVVYGYAGLPHLRPGRLPIRAALALHCASTAVIAALSVVLARVVEDGDEPLSDGLRWLLCSAVAIYFALGLVAAVVSRGFRFRLIWIWVPSGIVIPLLLGGFATEAHGTALVGYVAAVVLGHLWVERRIERAIKAHRSREVT